GSVVTEPSWFKAKGACHDSCGVNDPGWKRCRDLDVPVDRYAEHIDVTRGSCSMVPQLHRCTADHDEDVVLSAGGEQYVECFQGGAKCGRVVRHAPIIPISFNYNRRFTHYT
ncbi:MAG: hypothetical protein JWN72_786, partial [Thermoleophilia bacterium]|nr:hypothetical protein [Thermoleophilia bacterium]